MKQVEESQGSSLCLMGKTDRLHLKLCVRGGVVILYVDVAEELRNVLPWTIVEEAKPEPLIGT